VRPNKDEKGFNHNSVPFKVDAEEDFFDFSESQNLGKTQGRVREENKRETKEERPFTTEYKNMFDSSEDSDEDMFAAAARTSEGSSFVKKRPSINNLQQVDGRRERHRASLLPKRLANIPESDNEQQYNNGAKTERCQPKTEAKGGGMFNILD
jgi:hypothetical protein